MGFFIMKNIFKIVFVIIGTLIGAGFASGQEMYLFFFSYGLKGIWGILVSSILMGIVIYKILNLINKYNITNYKEFLDILIKRDTKHRYLNIKYIINLIINIFILVTFFIMIAGFGAYIEQELGINSLIGSGILAALSFIIFMTSVKGLVKASEFLIPILILFLTIIGFINIHNIHILNIKNYIIQTNNSSWLLNSILYCSYNSILLIPVLFTLKDYIKNRKQNFLIATITTLITIILSIIIFLLLIKIDVDISKLEMPIVYVVSHMSKTLRLIYGFIILSSIFTTSISLGMSFLQDTARNKKRYTQIAVLMCITSILVSKIGFANLVNLLYPIFGYIGLVQILKIIIHKTKKR